MKRERRQELKTNDLAVQIQRFSEYLRQRASALIGVALAGIVLFAGLAYYKQSVSKTKELGWEDFYESPAKLDRTASDYVDQALKTYQGIIDAHKDTDLAAHARRVLVEFCLSQIPELKDAAKKTEIIGLVEADARMMLDQAGNNSAQKAAALNWLAASEENLFAIDGNLEHKGRAKGYLERIRNDEEFRGTPFQADVLARLNDFDSLWEPVVFADPPPPEVEEAVEVPVGEETAPPPTE